jgi:prephenate dehydrogenase/chorismate mutase
LKVLRRRIDRLNERLVQLINQRAKLAVKIGALKRKHGLPINDSVRENFILEHISRINPGPLSGNSVRRIMGELISACRHIEEEENPLKSWAQKLGTPTISICGLGLIGASLALALRARKRSCRLVGYDTRAVGKTSYVDSFSTNPSMALKTDIIILALPVHAIIEFIKRYARKIAPGTLVMDMGSTKRDIYDTAKRALPRTVYFIGGHPLAGKASSGAKNADADLFEQRPFVLVPGYRLPASKLTMAKTLVSGVGAIPVVMDAEKHDQMVAATSHLPNLASVALSLSAESLLNGKEVVSGPGFQDMTRLALSDYTLWKDIASTNKDFVIKALTRHQEILSGLIRAVRRGRFQKEFDRARRFRQRVTTI